MTLMDYYDPYNMMGYDPYKGMTDEERLKACLRHIAAMGVALLLALTVCALLGSCKPQERILTIVTHTVDTLRLTQVHRDSIYMHDSIHVSEKGDTVTVERWHTRWRDRWHSDTVYRARTDSVPYPVEVVRKVPAELTWWQQTRLYIANAALALLAAAAALWAAKKKFLP